MKFVMGVQRGNDAIYFEGVACDEGGGAFGIGVGRGDGKGASGMKVVLDVD